MIFVTGGAGFIGTNFVHKWFQNSREPGIRSEGEGEEHLLVLDQLTYAGRRENLQAFDENPRFHFVQGDIGDKELLEKLFTLHRPRALIHFAAESHVDRSILGPEAFISTNVIGTFRLLEVTHQFFQKRILPQNFRFLHVSTDEVYGSLSPEEPPFTEVSPYKPNSPYSASKASSDHWVRAYHHTYGLPTITTHCSNNYGPYQHPEKLIPLALQRALEEKSIPIYGDGQNIRDWLYVEDHCEALLTVLKRGKIGEVYNIGGHNEEKNISLINVLCHLLDLLRPRPQGRSYAELITFVPDRLGHDRRYAIDHSKIQSELGWAPRETPKTGLKKTLQWYLDNTRWLKGSREVPL